MNDRIQLLVEAEKRGILPPEKRVLLDEARKRGLVNDFGNVKTTVTQTQNADPMQGMTASQVGRAGFGKAMRDTGYGLVQSVAEGGFARALPETLLSATGMELPSRENFVSRWAKDKANENAAIDSTLTSTTPGFAGNIGGHVTMAALPGANLSKGATLATMAPKLLAGAGEGAIYNSVQPVQDGQSRTANTVLGGAFGAGGAGITGLLGKAANGGRAALDEGTQRLLAEAEKRGIPISPMQLSQNPMVRTVTDQLGRLPFSGARGRNEAAKKAFNREVAKTFGEEGVDAVTSDVYAAAKKRIGGEFNRLTEDAKLAVTPQFLAKLKAAQDEAEKFGSADAGRIVANRIQELLGKADENGIIPGRAYQAFDSTLSSTLKGGGQDAFYIGALQNAVRDAMGEALPKAEKEAWATARKQSGALKTVRDLVDDAKPGGINPQALLSRLRSNNAGKERMAQGSAGDLGTLGSIGSRFFKATPDSGTADRLLVNGGVAGLLAGGTQAGYIDPKTALVTGGLLAANRAGLGAANSPIVRTAASKAVGASGGLLGRITKAAPANAEVRGLLAAMGLPLVVEDRKGEVKGSKRAKK